MKAMTYYIRFEESLDLGNIYLDLKEIESPIRLEIGDKIAISYESFDERPGPYEDVDQDIVEMMELLSKKAIKVSRFNVYFEISDIFYDHVYYDDIDLGFNGKRILKGK